LLKDSDMKNFNGRHDQQNHCSPNEDAGANRDLFLNIWVLNAFIVTKEPTFIRFQISLRNINRK